MKSLLFFTVILRWGHVLGTLYSGAVKGNKREDLRIDIELIQLISLSSQVFHANADATEVVLNRIPQPVLARFVRIRPQMWKNGIALRFELYGCQITGKKDVVDNFWSIKDSCRITWHRLMIHDL